MLSAVDLPTSAPPVNSFQTLTALTEMLFLGYMSDFTTETDRIFLKAIPWELKRKNNVQILLALHCSFSTAKLQQTPAWQKELARHVPGDHQHEGDVQVSYM